MKTTTRLVFVLLAVVQAAAFAQEWGVNATTDAGIAGRPDFGFSGGLTLAPWLDSDFFDMSARVRAGYPEGITGDLESLNIRFRVEADGVNPAMDLIMGRFLFTEPSGHVLSTPADGLGFTFRGEDYELAVNIGYTGLLLKTSHPIVLTKADTELLSNPNNWFGARRLIAQAIYTMPEFYGQSVAVSATMQQDLNRNNISEYFTQRNDTLGGGTFNSQYFTIRSEGLPLENFVYHASATLGTGTTLTWIEDPVAIFTGTPSLVLAFMCEAGFEYYLPDFMSSSFGADFGFASGDADASTMVEGNTAGILSLFTPVTPQPLSSVLAPSLANLAYLSLGGSLKPVEGMDLLAGADLLAFFKPGKGASGATGIAAEAPSPFVGIELDLYGTYRIMSDMAVSLNGGVFLPGSDPAGAFPKDSPLRYSMQAALSIEM